MLARPRLAVTMLALMILLPGPLLLDLELNNAPEIYFPSDAPAVTFDRELREQFPEDQVLVGLFEAESPFEVEHLERLHALTQTLEADDRIERVLGVTTLDHIRPTSAGFAVERLVIPDQLSVWSSDRWRRRAISDPFAPGLVVSDSGDAVAVIVRPYELQDSLQRLRLSQFFRESVDEHDLSESLTAVAGQVALDVAQLRAMIQDLALLVPGTMAVGLLLLWWLFRRVLVVVLAAATISAVTGPAMGLLVLLGKPFTLITAIGPPLLTALTVAMLMHLFNALLHAARRGHQGEARVEAALAVVARPTLFMALTTAAGLLSLTVSPIRPIQTFGIVAAFGVLCAASCTLLLLPAILRRWDHGPWQRLRGAGMGRLDRFSALAARLAIRRAGWILAVAAVVVVVAIPQIRNVEVETDLYAFFGKDHPISRATQRVEHKLSGVMPLEIVFDGPRFDSLKAPERLQAIHRIQGWLDRRPEVAYTLSLPDLVGQMHWAFNGGENPAMRRVPDSPQLVAQYLFIYDGRDLYDVVDRDFTRTRMMINLNVHGAGAINYLLDEIDAYLAQNPPADLEWRAAGMARLFADQERLLIKGQVRSLIAVSLLLTALMLVMWRSVPIAAASMLPNLAPIALIFAFMGLFGIWLDMATAMVASVAVGIAVDDTIHLLHGYLHRRRRGLTVPGAMARTFRQTGRAITATTLVLSAQFLLLTFSDFQPTNAFGSLTALGLLVALLFDLLVLPSLLVLAHRVRARSG